ncbi:MAG: hypothetical protein VYA62_07230 [Planctomycetota bacterium]|nr:hypothetical protein [Planctomycetota bacterium]
MADGGTVSAVPQRGQAVASLSVGWPTVAWHVAHHIDVICVEDGMEGPTF